MIVALLVKDENAGTCPAERAAQQTGCAKAEDFGETRDKLRTEGLVQAIVEGGGKRGRVAGCERGGQQRRPLDVEGGV